MAAESSPEKDGKYLTDEEIQMFMDVFNPSTEDLVKAKQESQDLAVELLDLIKNQEQAEESQKYSHETFMQKREELLGIISRQFYETSTLRRVDIVSSEPNTLADTPEAVEKRTEDLYNEFFGKYLQPSDDRLKKPETILIVKDTILTIKQRVMIRTYVDLVRFEVDFIKYSGNNVSESDKEAIKNLELTKEHFGKSIYTFDDEKMLKDLINECKFEISEDGTIEMLDRAANDPLRNLLADLLKKPDYDDPPPSNQGL
jgi:hypothetical protein